MVYDGITFTGGATSSGSEDMKVFYALGVNVARQVGADLKPVLSEAEIAEMIKGFTDSMNGKAGDERQLLTKYGPKLNDVLTARAGKAVEMEKSKGAAFAAKYLLNNAKAVKTASGLIYHETVAGIGKQVLFFI